MIPRYCRSWRNSRLRKNNFHNMHNNKEHIRMVYSFLNTTNKLRSVIRALRLISPLSIAIVTIYRDWKVVSRFRSTTEQPNSKDQDAQLTREEFEEVVHSMKNVKAQGVDDIPAEVWKHSAEVKEVLSASLLWYIRIRDRQETTRSKS